MNKLYIKSLIFLLGCFASASCIDDAEFVEIDDLGIPKEEYILDTEGGSIEIPVYTNKFTSVNFIEDCEWASINTSEMTQDGTIKVEFEPNSSYPRHAKIEFVTATRRDTCALLQKGVQEESFVVDKYVITSYYNRQNEMYESVKRNVQKFIFS